VFNCAIYKCPFTLSTGDGGRYLPLQAGGREMMKKRKFVIFLISLMSIFVFALNGFVMAQPSKQQIEAFRSARTVRIVVNQSYGSVKGVSLPFEDIAERLLGYAGIRVVPNFEDYDLMLKIEAKGWALGASYTDYVRDYWLYTGASLSGSISLGTQGVPIYKKTFEGSKAPPAPVPHPSGTPPLFKFSSDSRWCPLW
jgi:hypothetical protein